MFVKVYSRKSIIESIFLYEKLKSYRKVAFKTGISKSTIHRWCTKFHFMFAIHKSKTKKKTRSRKFKDLCNHIKHVFSIEEKLRFLSLQSIRDAVSKHFQYKDLPHLSTIHRCIKKSGISRRRFANIVVVKGNNNLQGKIDTFKTAIRDVQDDAIMCIDETGFSNHSNAFYGYFQRGKTPISITQTKREKMSSIVAITKNGVVASQVQEKPYNKDSFLAFLKDKVLPTIPIEVKYLLMDNVSFHHNKEVISLLDKNCIKPLFIPPYSPQFNPIEEFFSVVKSQFRKQYHASGVFKDAVKHTLNGLSIYKGLANYYIHMRRML